jgi:hypothetical protein
MRRVEELWDIQIAEGASSTIALADEELEARRRALGTGVALEGAERRVVDAPRRRRWRATLSEGQQEQPRFVVPRLDPGDAHIASASGLRDDEER